jgi:hypothetical protein
VAVECVGDNSGRLSNQISTKTMTDGSTHFAHSGNPDKKINNILTAILVLAKYFARRGTVRLRCQL